MVNLEIINIISYNSFKRHPTEYIGIFDLSIKLQEKIDAGVKRTATNYKYRFCFSEPKILKMKKVEVSQNMKLHSLNIRSAEDHINIYYTIIFYFFFFFIIGIVPPYALSKAVLHIQNEWLNKTYIIAPQKRTDTFYLQND